MELNIEEIYKWIDSYTISRQKRNIARDFSDAVPVAEILKQHFPKAVDLHNYSPKNAVAQKIVNWTILNKKVLCKLNISLSQESIEELSKSTPGVIERVLCDIKTKILQKEENEKSSGDVYLVEGLSSHITGSVVPIKVKNGSRILDQKIIPSDMYENMKKDIESKDQAIVSLEYKVTHLDSLLKIKDERINDLTEQIKRQNNSQYYSSSSGRLLSKLMRTESKI